MTKIRVEIVEKGFSSDLAEGLVTPAMTTVLNVEEITTLGELEEFFRRIAVAAGFFYVGEVECKKYAFLHLDGELLGGYERKKMTELLAHASADEGDEV